LVLAAEMPRGTFLVRKREGGEYALTINDLKYDSLDVRDFFQNFFLTKKFFFKGKTLQN